MFPQILHTGPLNFSLTQEPRKNVRKEKMHEVTFLHWN